MLTLPASRMAGGELIFKHEETTTSTKSLLKSSTVTLVALLPGSFSSAFRGRVLHPNISCAGFAGDVQDADGISEVAVPKPHQKNAPKGRLFYISRQRDSDMNDR